MACAWVSWIYDKERVSQLDGHERDARASGEIVRVHEELGLKILGPRVKSLIGNWPFR